MDAATGRERGHISCRDDIGPDAPAGVDFEPAIRQQAAGGEPLDVGGISYRADHELGFDG